MNDKLLMFTIAAVALVLGILIGMLMLGILIGFGVSQHSDETEDTLEKIASELEEHGGEIRINNQYGTTYGIRAGWSVEVSGDYFVIHDGKKIIPYGSIAYITIND